MSGALDRVLSNGYETISLRPEVLQELRAFQGSVRAPDYSSAIAQLLHRPEPVPMPPSPRRRVRSRTVREPCHHVRCDHLREENCTAACRRPGRPKGRG